LGILLLSDKPLHLGLPLFSDIGFLPAGLDVYELQAIASMFWDEKTIFTTHRHLRRSFIHHLVQLSTISQIKFLAL
jgi:hypothetical protein